MLKCKHECDCGEKWECIFPYYSNYQYFEDVIESGSYCNSYCPICSPMKRDRLDSLFKDVQETGYIKNLKNKNICR